MTFVCEPTKINVWIVNVGKGLIISGKVYLLGSSKLKTMYIRHITNKHFSKQYVLFNNNALIKLLKGRLEINCKGHGLYYEILSLRWIDDLYESVTKYVLTWINCDYWKIKQ